MANLPAELITEILLKLPVKSLLQFKCVSKSWLSLISSPEFAKTHLLLSASNKDYTHHGVMFKVDNANRYVKDCSLSDLLYDSVTEAHDLDYPGKNLNACPSIVGSINGLICLAIRVFGGLYDLFLWNPSIRKYKKLPNFSINLSRRNYYCFADFVDCKFGFAYDEFRDDYKVVGILPNYKYGGFCRVEVKIYSLKSDSWRRIDDFQGRELLDDSTKFVNGKLHWLDKQWNIISIDLNDDKWAKVEHYFKGFGVLKLGVFGSDLSVSSINTWSTRADVWVMKEYGVKESWTKIFTITYPDNHMEYAFYPTILMSNKGELLVHFGLQIMKYNLKDDSISYLDHVTNFAPCLEAEIYVKSLICPFSQKGPRMSQPRRLK